MSLQENTRKTRYRLTVGQKKEICEFKKQHPHSKQQQIADVFKNRYPGLSIDRSTVSKVLKNEETFLAVDDSEKGFRKRTVKYPMLEAAMNIWVQQVTAHALPLTEMLIKEKALAFAAGLEIDKSALSFSNGWIQKFKRRNNLKKITLHGEAASAPLDSLPEARAKLQEIISKYDLENVYNVDETGLFFRMLPNHTLSTDKKRAGKKMVSALQIGNTLKNLFNKCFLFVG